jgi:preprotein translocase subunit YajC
MSFFVLIALAFLLLWLLLIRPQRRRQSQQVTMQESLGVGDEVVTAGGLYGTVARLDEDEVAVEIADGVVVRIARRAIAGVIPEEEDAEDDELEEMVEDESQDKPTEAQRS